MLASILTRSSAQRSRVCLDSCSGCWEGQVWRSALICAVRHSSLGVFRSALCGEKGSQQNYMVFSFVTACGTFCASSWKQGERPMIHPELLSMLKKEQFNPLKLPPWLPSESPFPRKHTDIVQMYPNWRSIQKRRVV